MMYTGTANAVYQNMEYMERYHPDYVLILSGDHIYKMAGIKTEADSAIEGEAWSKN